MNLFENIKYCSSLRDRLFVVWRYIWTKMGSLFAKSCTSLIYVKDLDPVYNEIDDQMLYVLFYFLEDYIGQIYEFEGITADNLEEEFKQQLREHDQFSREMVDNKFNEYRKLFDLYHWWKVERPKRNERIEHTDKFYNDSEPVIEQVKRLSGNKEYSKACALDFMREEADHEEDLDKMIELLKLRRSMWF